ncbi:MAG: tRNA (guanine(26)-N(2)/guanine(27)-N(2))-dimethyltransferase [Methanobacteriota archaeon]|jgi:tRNA (guanine26-N2/guanine27-N2)-dimethyltransferase|nr:MAG: tRNA (guanine(26)-N(2)/guanine(27)-N(2))-dimethyltransferase [Euryarchaeota archaeon]|tara:strand:- start:4212 stop:5504 length:1293 start_codon:yes stop_codon:yes gene_type:complete
MSLEGWPGHIWLEGRTPVHLQNHQPRPSHMPRGPATKTGEGFLNPAMAPSRTRSVLLLADAIEHGWLVDDDKTIRILDALCATAVRTRRWRNEVPGQERLKITANDLDTNAIDWAKKSHIEHPIGDNKKWEIEASRFEKESRGEVIDGINWVVGDARSLMVETPFQWIDLDPFGSPVDFLDAAIQSLSRVGLLDVTATDTAALCGSAKTSAARRYGAVGILDSYMHDDAVRILLGTIARIAAMHDKVIHPVLSLFDGHHVRVSVILRRSKEAASDFLENIGYRIRGEPYYFDAIPTGEYSGPMWTGPLFDAEIAKRMTVERALELCAVREEDLISDWDERDIEHSKRELERTVRYISDCADLLSKEHVLYAVDDLGVMAGIGQIPATKAILAEIKSLGYEAERTHTPDTMIATNAPHKDVIEAVKSASAK